MFRTDVVGSLFRPAYLRRPAIGLRLGISRPLSSRLSRIVRSMNALICRSMPEWKSSPMAKCAAMHSTDT
jgi:hypothetical protein